MIIVYSPKFAKKLNSFEFALQEEVIEKIELFKDVKNHKQLKVHKLHGCLKNKYGFSVNYQTRIVFQYLPKKSKREVVFLAIGDHNVYK